jgi:hypothetical protein
VKLSVFNRLNLKVNKLCNDVSYGLTNFSFPGFQTFGLSVFRSLFQFHNARLKRVKSMVSLYGTLGNRREQEGTERNKMEQNGRAAIYRDIENPLAE